MVGEEPPAWASGLRVAGVGVGLVAAASSCLPLILTFLPLATRTSCAFAGAAADALAFFINAEPILNVLSGVFGLPLYFS